MGSPRTLTYDGLTPPELAARLRARSCLVLSQVTSTLDIVHELAGEGAPAGTVVLAEEQVAGRGRQGRRWLSPPGTGIWLGYLMLPGSEPASGVVALRVGLAVAAVVGDLGARAALKWPNDVLLEDRKLAGILCEARSAAGRGWIAIGVGLNVHGPLPVEVGQHGIALEEVIAGVRRVQVLELLVPRLHALSSAPALSADECEEYGTRDWLAGRELRRPVAGRAIGVDVDGALLIATGRGRERVLAGSVDPAWPAAREE